MNALHEVANLLTELAVIVNGETMFCKVCKAWVRCDDLQHDSDCRYIEAYKLLVRIDPHTLMKESA